MRVADRMAYNQVTKNVQKNRSDMSELQNQAATQKRINKPSDDPNASARVLASRTEERGGTQFLKNINIARSFLEQTDQSLQEVTDYLMRTKELAIQQANDAGASSETRRAVAAEIDQVHSQLIQVANRKLGDRFLFGGYKTNITPFDKSGEYAGDDGAMKIQINKEAFVAMNVPGDKIFLGKGLDQDGLIRTDSKVPKTAEELSQKKQQELQESEDLQERNREPIQLRSPAGANARVPGATESAPDANTQGIDILRSIKDFEIGLRVNDKEEIQKAIDKIDLAIRQVVNTRAQVGARLTALSAAQDSLQKAILDNKITASQLEDVDIFQVVSDINKTDSTLKASMETSSKVVNLSLLDFLK